MASDRTKQAIGRIENALTRLERVAGQQVSPASNPDPERAAIALRSLDALIADLKRAEAAEEPSHG